MKNPFKSILKSFGYTSGGTRSLSVGDIVTSDKFSNDLFQTQNYGQLASSGFIKNYISGKCIRAHMQAIGDLDIEIFINGDSIIDKTDRMSMAFKQLMRDPNIDYGWNDLIAAVYNGKTIDGSGYIYPTFYDDGRPMQMEYFRPDRVSKITSTDERVHSYFYSRGERQQTFPRDEEGRFDLIEWKAFNPIDEIQGLSAIRTAGLPIDSHTGGLRWNKQLVENSGKFSGIASIQDTESGASLNEDQLRQLEKKFNEKSNGGIGKWLISNAPIKIESMGLTPTECDWLEGIRSYAIGIATSLDYPPFLLGLESTTFNNQAEAKLDFYENSIIPKANHVYKLMSAFFSRKTGLDVEFKVDLSKIIALFPRMIERSEIAGKQFNDGLISQNEGRKIIGLEEAEFGDSLFVDKNSAPAGFGGGDPT